jgi:hypothetical protein
MNFSLRQMLAVVGAVAATCVGLVYSNQWLADSFYTLYVAALFAATVAAIALRGASRAFWLGFVAAAATYGGLTILGRYDATSRYFSLIQEGSIPSYFGEVVTSRILAFSYDFIAAEGGSGPEFQHKREFERFMPYMMIGHSAFALAFGWVGGDWARRLYQLRKVQASDPL